VRATGYLVRKPSARVVAVLAAALAAAALALAPPHAATGAVRAHRASAAATATATATASLAAVSCRGSSWCMAVGTYTSPKGARHALAQTWDGKSWRVLKPPGGSLTSVSCSASWFCMAAGGPTGAERWNGRSWREIAGPEGGAAGVSCGTRTLCMVAHQEGGVQVWNGTRWQVAAAPSNFCSGGAPGPCGFNDVACASASSCLAVGTWQVSSTEQDTLGFSWNGKQWHSTFPPSDGNPSELFSVSCAASSCLAAGGAYYEVDNGDIAEAASWNAKTATWTDVSPSLGTICTGFTTCSWTASLSCASASRCMAFGPRGNQWWDGAAWQPKPSVSAGRGSGLSTVACGGSNCLAVGYRTTGGARHTLAELWNGTTWKILPTPYVS